MEPDRPTDLAKMVCGVTGSSGYVGSSLVRRLRTEGVHVVEFQSGPKTASPELREFRLQSAPNPALFQGIDVLVHCAYDFGARSWNEIRSINVDGTRRLFESAAAGGVKRFVLFSTISAFPGCKSLYGRAKLETEAIASEHGAVIVRPGLVFGDHPGGMVRALSKVASFPVAIPLVGAGNAIQFVAHEDDLGGLIFLAVTHPEKIGVAPVVAAHPRGYSLREIMTALSLARGRRPRFISVPVALITAGLSLIESIGLRPRIRSDSLVSLLCQDPKPDFSALERIGASFRPFEPPAEI